jgi:hypothetical protein
MCSNSVNLFFCLNFTTWKPKGNMKAKFHPFQTEVVYWMKDSDRRQNWTYFISTENWNQFAYSVVSPLTKFSNGGSADCQSSPRAHHSPAQPIYRPWQAKDSETPDGLYHVLYGWTVLQSNSSEQLLAESGDIFIHTLKISSVCPGKRRDNIFNSWRRPPSKFSPSITAKYIP